MVNQSEYEAKLIKACEEWNVILKRTKGTTARGIDSPSVSSQQHVMWVLCFFPITLKIKCKRRGAKKNNTDKQTEGKRKEKENVDVGLHSKLLLPEALCCATFIWSCTSEKKKKISSSHSQMASQSKANVKRTHMTAGAPVKKSTARRTWWIYRWLYVQGDDGKAITNVSVSFYFHGQNNLWVCVWVCVLKWPQMKMLPFGSECFYLLDGSKTGTSVFF